MLLKGRTDRIDFTGNTYRIIDYKTSKIDPKDYNISDPDVLMLSGYKTDYPFQLLLYALMLTNHTEPKIDAIEAGVLPLRSISSGMVKVKIDNSENLKGFLPAFASMVENMLVSLCDAQIPFVQTEDKNNCSYCPFKSICMRG